MKRILLSLILVLLSSFLVPAQAGDGVLFIASDHSEGYDRSLFKHWIDADKNGCDTRKEVLIAEAIVKPKKGAKCVLTGGKWISAYDGKSHTKDSGLDVDHLVPLAEAWRSGAWAWTDKERENYSNFIEQEWMLNAVTASVNRSKGDSDIANWLPTKNVCAYLRGWVIVKAYFDLTVDAAEAKVINKNYSTCGLGTVTKESVTPTATVDSTPSPTATATPAVSVTPTPASSATPTPTATASVSPTPSATQVATVSPGAFCSPAGATGKSAAGVAYTCKTSSTDTRNRWRP